MKEIRCELPEQDCQYLFENASDAIWVHDMRGNIKYANKAFKKLSGYTGEELASMNIKRLLHGQESQEIAKEVRRRLLNGEEIKQPYEQQFIRRDGTTGTCMMATSLVTSNGKARDFQNIGRDITEERQLQENMRFYVQEIIKAQEDERKRIARELHDEVSPSLLLLNQQIDAMTSCSRPRLSGSLKGKLEGLRRQTIEALESVRRIAQDLRPRILDDLGLQAALEWMAVERSLPSEVQLLLFRIAQAALHNGRRHAEASTALVTVEFTDDKTILTVKDDGQGFELPERYGDLAGIGKLGLAGMYERAQLMRGKLRIESELGKGTKVTVEVPVRDNLGPPVPKQKELESLISDLSGVKTKTW